MQGMIRGGSRWWWVLVLLLGASGCRKDGRTAATDTPSVAAHEPTGDAGASAATTGGTAAPSSADAGTGTVADGAAAVELPPFAPEPEAVVPPELPLHLMPRDRALRYSGSVVAAGGGGSVIVATSSGNHAGYVFERVEAGWVESFRFELAVFETLGGREQVAVSGDGDTIAVARLGDHDCPGGTCAAQGQIGGWDRLPGGWARTPNLPASDELAYQGLGAALAIDAAGDVIVASTRDEPGAYVFRRSADRWLPPVRLVAEAPRGFGVAVAIDGDRIAVGAPGWEAPETGAVVLFERREEAWVEAGRVAAPREADRTFGSTVALAGDLLVAGGYGVELERGGAAFVFERVDGAWRRAARLEPRPDAEQRMYGRGSAIWDGGRAISVQSLYSAHFFVRGDSGWAAVEVLGGQQSPEEVRGLAAAGPAVALLTVQDVLLRAVPGLDAASVPAAPVRPAVVPPDCRRSRRCVRACATDADCCPEPPCGEGMWSSVCRNAACRLRGCTSDEECAAIPNSRCFPDATDVAVEGLCAVPCAVDGDCQPPYRCVAGERCALGPDNPWRCYSDLDCARHHGLERCDVGSGCCECGDGAYCERPTFGGPGLRCRQP